MRGSTAAATIGGFAARAALQSALRLARRCAARVLSCLDSEFPPCLATCVIGLQWGDEAKGKIVDLLTREHDFVVRYQGGANAGHTVVVGDQVYKLSLLPSGILTPGVTCVIASGVVLNPARVIEELDELAKRGAGHADNLRISDRAHVIFPWHFAEDRALDKSTSDGENIGTTGRGIGPCYRDKVGRSHAMRLGDLYRADFRAQVEHIVAAKNRVLAVLYPANEFKPLDAAAIFREYSGYAERLRPYVCDTTELLLAAAEARQADPVRRRPGALLDVDHGTYPFVTSSNSSGVGIASGSGVPARHIDRSHRRREGVFDARRRRAVSDRAGQRHRPAPPRPRQRIRHGHPPPAALRLARRRRRALHEPAQRRRFDRRDAARRAERARRAQDLHGLRDRRQANRRASPATSTTSAARSRCTRRCPAGRKKSPTAARCDELPANARAYLRRISELVGQPVEMVSVGPERDQTIVVSKS